MKHLRGFLLVTVSILLATLRVLGFKSESFQSIAHIWMGLPIAFSMMGSVSCIILAILLSVVEVLCFFKLL